MGEEYIVVEAGLDDSDEAPFVNVLFRDSSIEAARDHFAVSLGNKLGVDWDEEDLETFKEEHSYAVRRGRYYTFNPAYILKVVKI